MLLPTNPPIVLRGRVHPKLLQGQRRPGRTPAANRMQSLRRLWAHHVTLDHLQPPPPHQHHQRHAQHHLHLHYFSRHCRHLSCLYLPTPCVQQLPCACKMPVLMMLTTAVMQKRSLLLLLLLLL